MRNALLIQETFVNAAESYQYGESDKYEPFTDDLGVLYRALVREHGRCTGKVYVDMDGKPDQPVGWVFQKRKKYDDCEKTYLVETWVTLYEAKDEVTVKVTLSRHRQTGDHCRVS